MKKPNLIFVLLDGARWDRLHTSLEFLELQKTGVLFNNVTTAMPYTFGSLNVTFTGLYGKENGVNGYYKVLKLKENIPILPEILQKFGYFTARGLITDQVLSPRGYDLRMAYDEYKEDITLKHIDLLKRSFDEAGERPVFALLQFSRIHTVTVSEVLKKFEWDDEEFYNKIHENLEKFDRVFNEAGQYAKKIKESIDSCGKSNNTIIIFFTDHGTGVGERFGERNYGSYTYEETIRTFYLFIGPSILQNKTYDDLLSTIDILPTIIELCQIDLKLDIPGKSFAKCIFNDMDESFGRDVAFSETGALHGPYPSPEESNVFCIRSATHKMIFNKTTEQWELYDLTNDRNEKINLIGKNLDIENVLKNKLTKWINR